MSSSSTFGRQSIDGQTLHSQLSTGLRRNRSMGDLQRIGDVEIDFGFEYSSRDRDHGAEPQGQSNRRAMTYPYPSNLLFAEDSARTTASLSVSQAILSPSPRAQRPPITSSSTTQPRPDSGYPQIDPETERVMAEFQNRQSRTFRGRLRRVRTFLGFGPRGSRIRRELVQLIWTCAFGFVQVSISIALMSLAAVRSSPQKPSLTEWKACDKPLGIWNALWIAKVLVDCGMSFWSWTRDRKVRLMEQQDRDREAQHGSSSAQETTSRSVPPSSGLNGSQAESTNETPAAVAARERRRRQEALPFTKLFKWLNFLLSCFIISWFINANIFIYTSLQTCRFEAPHLWWLTFSILSIQYIMIVEVFAIAVILFIIGPLIFLFWNIFLICIGRHPLQNPHHINPEIGKLSKAIVQKIPLVLYIPPPPEEDSKGKGVMNPDLPDTQPSEVNNNKENAVIVDGAVVEPSAYVEERAKEMQEMKEDTHSYPPSSPSRPATRSTKSRSRFSFFRRKSTETGSLPLTNGDLDNSSSVGAWEDTWERGDDCLPFIRLAGNRAVCAVCLMDFEAPQRRVSRNVIRGWSTIGSLLKGGSEGKTEVEKGKGDSSGEVSVRKQEDAITENVDRSNEHVEEVPVSSPESENTLTLVNAGEGPQPLRLLPCGHVFHKTCIDPWLLDVSGRCPTCQRPVVLPEAASKKTRDANSV